MPAVNTGRTNPEATPDQWIILGQDDPIETPDVPALWDFPDPPELNTQPDPPDPPPPTSAFGGQTQSFIPNSRHPTTGAPTWNPTLPPGTPMPPGRASVTPNGTMPVTNAPVIMPPHVSTMQAPLPASQPWTNPLPEAPPADRGDHASPPGGRLQRPR